MKASRNHAPPTCRGDDSSLRSDASAFERVAAKRPRPVWTLERRCRLSGLLIVGLSYGQAARVLGVPRGSVCWATARYGIGRPAANTSRATGLPRKPQDQWSDERLTQRWADRRAA